jgi:hypothetical protein
MIAFSENFRITNQVRRADADLFRLKEGDL